MDDHFKEMFNPAPGGVILQKPQEEVNTFLKMGKETSASACFFFLLAIGTACGILGGV